MKLNFNGKLEEVKLKVASPKIKQLFVDKLKSISNFAQQEKIFDLIKKSESDVENLDANKLLQDAILKGELNINEVFENEETINKKDNIYRELCSYLIDDKQLTSKQKEIFSDDFNSDFWYEQDYTEIMQTVDSFRTIFKLENF